MLRAILHKFPQRTFTPVRASALHSSVRVLDRSRDMERRETRIKEQQGKREKLAYLKSGEFRKKISNLKAKGRSGGGQRQLLEARMRRSRDQKEKFHSAMDYINRTTKTQQERVREVARVLRQRSQSTKNRKVPGSGFTPVRFKLLPIENESNPRPAVTSMKGLGLRKNVLQAAVQYLEERRKISGKVSEDPIRPTEIQGLGIPQILSGDGKTTSNVFLAAETGGGKTLAYALPLMSQLKDESDANPNVRVLGSPRALVLVPSRELAKQVLQIFKEFSHIIKMRVIGMHLGVARRRLREQADQTPIDIVVATPVAAIRYLINDPLFKSKAIHKVVIDEADSMMDTKNFKSQTTEVLDLIRRNNERQGRKEQVVYASATLPKLIKQNVSERHPDIVFVSTQDLHRAPLKLSQTFIDVSKEYQGRRLNALSYVLKTAARDKHIMVFCNTKVHANIVHRQLYRKGIPSLLLVGSNSAAVKAALVSKTKKLDAAPDGPRNIIVGGKRPPKGLDAWEKATWYAGQPIEYIAETAVPEDKSASARELGKEAENEAAEPISGVETSDIKAPIPLYNREEVLECFLGNDPIPKHLLPDVTPETEVLTQQERKIIVCTDLASRGLDTLCVNHVILFDFPTTAIDYLHRSGRTARNGSRGKVTALVSKKDRRLADQIRLAVRQGAVIN
ncbi:hypothetical protein GGI07_000460 [Coemansia sp. Benny D115]|nr:hypothetical protein GGI07_000460 [Coemansia sp. Benny D115]